MSTSRSGVIYGMSKPWLAVESVLLEVFECHDLGVCVWGIDSGPSEFDSLILRVERHALSCLFLHIEGCGVPAEKRVLAFLVGGTCLVLTFLGWALWFKRPINWCSTVVASIAVIMRVAEQVRLTALALPLVATEWHAHGVALAVSTRT